jgi:POT family proton-dependent oligopeptide transporter
MKQPKILPFFFLTEMWERFGFYTVEALLVLYMTYALQFSDDSAYTILGVFTALVYIMPLLGGYLADKWIGYRFAILLGGILLSLGYACLTIFSYSVFTGMTLIILGNGLLKPNISTFLGQFYAENDARREGGFTLFYVGINVGVLGATGFSGFIREWYGWEACFGVACAGIILGILFFVDSFDLL